MRYSTASPVIKLILHKPGGRRSFALIPPNNQSVSSIISAVCEYLNEVNDFKNKKIQSYLGIICPLVGNNVQVI